MTDPVRSAAASVPESTRESATKDVASIPSNYSRLIAQELGLHTKGLPALLVGTGLGRTQFLQEERLISGQQQIRILENALQLTENEGFGLSLGKRLTPLTHGMMGFMANSSQDLYTAVQAISLFVPTRMNFAGLELSERNGLLEGRLRLDIQMSDAVRRCLAETFARMFFAIAEFIVGRPLVEAEVFFEYAEPRYGDDYRTYLPGSLNFHAENLMFRVPMAVCRKPNVSANHENYQLALAQCETMLEQLQRQTLDYQTRVKKLMLSRPPGTLDEEGAAAAFFLVSAPWHVSLTGRTLRLNKYEMASCRSRQRPI